MAQTYRRRFQRAIGNPLGHLFGRILSVLALIAAAWLMLWLERTGLRDSRGTPLGPLDVLYFAVVTVTTLGYGDIVPVSPEARAIVTFGITPLRIVAWLLLLGTAYEFILKRSLETMELKKLRNELDGHVIVCGFGVKGRTAVNELTMRGTPAHQIVVIDPDDAGAEDAARLGVHFYHGNASSEQVLRDMAIDKAAQAIVVPNNDQACVLIVLTMRELAPTLMIRAAAREEENVKLIRRSGANTVIAPSVDGGRLLASSTSSPLATELLEELLQHGEGADIVDVEIGERDAGKTARDAHALEGMLVMGVRKRGGEWIDHEAAHSLVLERGDVVVAYTRAMQHPPGTI